MDKAGGGVGRPSRARERGVTFGSSSPVASEPGARPEAEQPGARLATPSLTLAAGLSLILVLAVFVLGLLSGSSGWGLPSHDILWKIRVPRVLAAFGTGAALALAGAIIQLVTRNPLGDPHVLGVTGGASVGAVLSILLVPA